MATFDEQYPNIAWWVRNGHIKIGLDEYDDSFIRVTDEGGLIRESGEAYETVAEALAEADAAIRRWADNVISFTEHPLPLLKPASAGAV